MNNKMKAEIMYNGKKKNVWVAYLLGLVLGGFGVHYFYCGKPEYGVVILGLLVTTFVIPPVSYLYLFAVFVGVIHTYFVVEEVNKQIKLECELLMED